MKYSKTLLAAASLMTFAASSQAQSLLYPQHFDLSEVRLLDSDFKKAMVINDRLLLQYDADRLMTPFVRQAGLSGTTDKSSRYYEWEKKHPSFQNWGLSNWSLEGHVGGHYLTALALAYASADDEQTRAAMKERLEYCLGIIKECQDAYKDNAEGMKGFVGGQPINQIWTGLYKGELEEFNKYGYWVPFYCEHKVLAGLRDAYVYAKSELAKEMFRAICDWSAEVVKKLSDEQMQRILGFEHGGMNETLADAYKIFGEKRFLDAAKRYSHVHEINGMQGADYHYNEAFLDRQHANTQVPKFIGFARIDQLSATKEYDVAARNFWDDVANHRTVCIGGNSVDEHFVSADNAASYINNLNGPESCNSNNMLKLSEIMFDKTHDAKYADFYESTMLNHILATQDPQTGGYVYFTSLRPQSYKIYSTVNESMWCCVGTGMENHGKYGHFIYTHSDNRKGMDTLFVNLFVPSELNSGKFAISQETDFPYGNKVRITINKSGKYRIAVRHPSWTTKDFAIYENGVRWVEFESKPPHQIGKVGEASYFVMGSKWKKGDVIEITLPMEMRYEECPNLKDYVAFKYGPVLLAASIKDSKLRNEYGHEGRMDHAPGSMADMKEVTESPLLIGERESVLNRIRPVDPDKLTFAIDARSDESKGNWSTMKLEPFYKVHHARYMIYWYQQTKEEYQKSDMAEAERQLARLNDRTIDYVGTGEQQSEAGHDVDYSASSTHGAYNGEFYRDVQSGGYIEYTLNNIDGQKEVELLCRFTAADRGRTATISIDGQVIAEIAVRDRIEGKDSKGFFNYVCKIPAEVLSNADGSVKEKMKMRLTASGHTPCPGLYYVRLLRAE